MNPKASVKRRGGLVLTPDGLQVLNESLKKWWDSSEEKQKSLSKKLTREQRWKKLSGLSQPKPTGDGFDIEQNLDIKTVDSIFLGKPVRESTLRYAFSSLNIPFVKDRYCVSVGPSSGNLPALPESGVLRQEEVAAVRALLEPCKLVTLTGPGGIGKTWLAKRIGKEMVRYFADGVWFVELEGVTKDADLTVVLQQVAKTFGVQEEKARPLRETVLAHLRNKEILLILDNCEHVLTSCAILVDALISHCQSLRILATSREYLNIPFERIYRVPTLSLPDAKMELAGTKEASTQLMEYEAVCFFLEIARKHHPDFEINEQTSPKIVSICRRLDGIPLALELAAARVRLLSLDELEQELENCLPILKGGSRVALARHQTLRATMDWSYNLLNPAEKAFLRRLAVFAGGFSREAAGKICGGGSGGDSLPVRGEDTLNLLSSLIDKNLVVFREREGKGRYRLLETVRQYAQEQLIASGERDDICRLHQGFFFHLVKQAVPHLRGKNHKVWYRRLEEELENIRLMLTFSRAATDSEIGLLLCELLHSFWTIRGSFVEGRQWCAWMLEASKDSEPTPARAQVQLRAGLFAFDQTDYPSARAHLEDCLGFWRRAGDRSQVIRLLNTLGDIAITQADYSFARVCLKESLALCQEGGNDPGMVRALYALGKLAHYEGDLAESCDFYEQSRALALRINNRSYLVQSLTGLAYTVELQEEYRQARSYLEQVLTICRESGDMSGIANTLKNLGGIAHQLKDFVYASRCFEESVQIWTEIGDQRGLAYALIGQAVAYQSLSEETGTDALLHQCLSLFQSIEDLIGTGWTFYELGKLSLSKGDHSAAWAYHFEGVKTYCKIDRVAYLVDSLFAIIALATLANNYRAVAVLCGFIDMALSYRWPLKPSESIEYEAAWIKAREILGEDGFTAGWARGHKMKAEEIVAFIQDVGIAESFLSPLSDQTDQGGLPDFLPIK